MTWNAIIRMTTHCRLTARDNHRLIYAGSLLIEALCMYVDDQLVSTMYGALLR
jgi:hypothetical protein